MTAIDVLIPGARSLTAALINQQSNKRVMILKKRIHGIIEVTFRLVKNTEACRFIKKLDAAMPIKKQVYFFIEDQTLNKAMDRRFSKTKSGRPADGSRHVDRAEFDKIALDHARSLGTIVLEEPALSAVKVNDR